MRRLILWACCLLPSLLLGQGTMLYQGISAYEQENYPEAIRTLSTLIEAKLPFEGGQLSQAHFYLAQAYWQVSQEAKFSQDYPQALLRAYNHLTAAKRLDKVQRYQTACETTTSLLLPALYEAGTQAYNRGDYELASQYFDRTYQLTPSKKEALLAKGYALWQIHDSVSAVKCWEKATVQKPIRMLQPQIDQYASALAQVVHARSSWGQVSQARETLQRAFNQYPNHPQLIEADLDLFLSHPDILTNGQKHFQDQVDRNEGNLDWKAALAHYHYYRGNTMEAISLFEQIQRQDSDHDSSNRFLASHYVSAAKSLLDGLAPLRGEARENQQEAILQNLLESLPYLSQLHENDPERLLWLEQLIAISEYLDLSKAKAYRKELRKIR
ncbi:MAG: tetratricopeptide repeat protein [Bacteroidota bacterium]